MAVRAHDYRAFDAAALVEQKAGAVVSVCLPARNEAATIGTIVGCIRNHLVEEIPLVDEILVMDDGSTDATAAVALDAGARVESTAGLLRECGRGTGKGEALWKSVFAAKGDLIVWCDADIVNFGTRFVVGLLGPLLTDPSVGFVKGFYERPIEGQVGTGGRTTELVARPLISLLFPRLATIVQPLAGEYAGRREVLEAVPFVQGYGVDLGLLIDVSDRFGIGAIEQVDLGTRVHRNRTLDDLSPQALSIMQTVFHRASVDGAAEPPVLVRPGFEPLALPFIERPPLISLDAYCSQA